MSARREYMREYMKRKRLQCCISTTDLNKPNAKIMIETASASPNVCIIGLPKTSADRVREYRARIRANRPARKVPKSGLQRNREWRERKKQLQVEVKETCASSIPAESPLSTMSALSIVKIEAAVKETCATSIPAEPPLSTMSALSIVKIEPSLDDEQLSLDDEQPSLDDEQPSLDDEQPDTLNQLSISKFSPVMAKTGAERQRAYRARLNACKLKKDACKLKKAAKSAAERQRECRERAKMKKKFDPAELNRPFTSQDQPLTSRDQPSAILHLEKNLVSFTPNSQEHRSLLPALPASQLCEVLLKESNAVDDTDTCVMPVEDNILTELNVKQLHKVAPQLLNSKFYIKCTEFGLRLVLLQHDHVVVSVEISAKEFGCRTELTVLGKPIPQFHPINELIVSPTNTNEIAHFVEKLEKWNLCPGNPDIGCSVPLYTWRCAWTGAIYSNKCFGLVSRGQCYNCQQCAISMTAS